MRAIRSQMRPATRTPSERSNPGRSGPRRVRWVAGAAVVVAAAGVSLWLTDPFGGASTGTGTSKSPTALARVTEGPLSSVSEVSATLGYAGSYTVINQAKGTVTALPSQGQVVSPGQALYQVDASPVVLLSGTTPAYRDLAEGASGPDVAELNAALVALGDVSSDELDPSSSVFSSATAAGLDQLQASLGLPQTGTLPLGQAVFLPTPVRVTATSATLGASLSPGQPVLEGTSTTRQVTIDLDAAQQAKVHAGDQVTITLPNNQTTPGTVASVGTVATVPSSASANGGGAGGSGPSGSSSAGSSSATPTIVVEVTPDDPVATGAWDQAPVQVSITTASVSRALIVPVTALLARAPGGYAVEVVSARGSHHLVPVSTGLFDDAGGLVQVSGSGLRAGQRVVVPATP